MNLRQANICFFDSLINQEQISDGKASGNVVVVCPPNDNQIWNAGFDINRWKRQPSNQSKTTDQVKSDATGANQLLNGYISKVKKETTHIVDNINELTTMLSGVATDPRKPKYFDVVWDSFVSNIEKLLDLFSESNNWNSFVNKYGG